MLRHPEPPDPLDQSLTDLISAQARATPDATALQQGSRTMSYARLDRLSNLWAMRLMHAGIGPEDLVAIGMPRSFALVVATLAVVKAGAGFLMLEPDHPPLRLRALLDDARPRALMTQQDLLDRLSSLPPECRVWALPDSGEAPEVPEQALAFPASDPSHLAYVVYTSGSTGQPKGVLIEQRGLRNLVHSLLGLLSVRSDDVILLSGSVSFDASLWRFFVPFLRGARLVLAEPGAQSDMPRLLRTISEHGVTIAGFVPSVLRALLEQAPPSTPSRLRHVICGGEILDVGLARRFLERFPGVLLSNSYGPSEASIACSWQQVDPHEVAAGARIVSIGRPMPNTAIYVLDEQLRQQPIGVRGEIYVGGVGVGRGYLRREELTARHFLDDPFRAQARMYRTGDVARWNADGTLEFLGRTDQQVKLRGLRIELGEIEAALHLVVGVREAAVSLYRQPADAPQLVAYIVAPGLGTPQLRHALRKYLPDYMLPGRFVVLDAMPHLPSGKIDRSALPAPANPVSSARPAAAQSRSEQAVLDIWERLLGRKGLGAHDDFFALGGHSLLAAQVISRLRADLGVNLPPGALFDWPTAAQLAREIDVRASGMPTEQDVQAITRLDRHGRRLALSFAQRRMWLLHQLDPRGAAYNIRMGLRLHGRLDRAALQQALDALVARHEAFRTVFRFDTDEPVAEIEPPGPALLEVLAPPAQAVGGMAPESAWLESAASRAADVFDLERGPLHRFLLARLSDTDHLLVVAMHHIVGDDWSFGVIAEDLGTLYHAGGGGRGVEPARKSIDFVDYAAWERLRLGGGAMGAQLRYWMDRLADMRPLQLPADKGHGLRASSQGGRVRLPLPQTWLQALADFSISQGVTPFMTLLATFAALLARWCSQEDICVACPIAGRSHADTQAIVGLLVNTLLLRLRVDPQCSFQGFLREQAREVALGAFSHQDLPFDTLVERLRGTGQPARDVEPRVMFNLINTPRQSPRFENLEVEYQPLPWQSTQFDLSMTVHAQGEAALVVDYSTELFDHASVDALARLYLLGLERALADPAQLVDALWDAPESHMRTLASWNGVRASLPEPSTVAELLERQRHRSATALSDAHGRALSYTQLWDAVDILRASLRARGIGRGSIVGICLHRDVGMVAAQLAVLSAGAAYVPLDPAFPSARLHAIVADAQPALLLTAEDLRERWAGTQVPVVVPEPAGQPRANGSDMARDSEHELDARADDPAYLIYTSGSTGKPKGVLVSHRAVVNFLVAMASRPGMGSGDVLVAVTTLGFDIAVLELLLGLHVGARICIASRDEALDPVALQARLRDSGATMMQATPATWQMLLDTGWEPPGGFKALVGGETLHPELARALHAHCAEVWNMYGPTETTVWSTCWKVEPDARRVSIGTPIANTQVQVLDPQGRVCPIGFSGEIHIGGHGVAIGYYRQPELDRAAFLDIGAEGGPAGRLYRTGDRGRWRHDGLLEHQGRLDFQIKLRGHRIEAAEIEDCLLADAEVSDAVVLLREDLPGDPRLVAYVVPRPGQSPAHAALREALRSQLPNYMIPQHVEILAQLPRLPNGKIDRAALPRPSEPTIAADDEPRGATEILLARIWSEQLGVPRISRGDNFFDLGGHSLLANRVAVAFEAATGQRIALRRLVHETLAQIAMGVETTNGAVAQNPTLPASRWNRSVSLWRGLRRKVGGPP